MRISDWSSDVCSSDLSIEYSMRLLVRTSGPIPAQWCLLSRPRPRWHNAHRPDRCTRRRRAALLRSSLIALDDYQRSARWSQLGAGSVSDEVTSNRCHTAHPLRARSTSTLSIRRPSRWTIRTEEHTSELQSLMRISYDV